MSKKKQDPQLAALVVRYPHIVSIAKIGKHSKPTRVVVRCTADGCTTKREIATQDAFQVVRCRPCQQEAAKAKRRKTPIVVEQPKAKAKAPKQKTRRRRMATRQTRLKSAASA